MKIRASLGENSSSSKLDLIWPSSSQTRTQLNYK